MAGTSPSTCDSEKQVTIQVRCEDLQSLIRAGVICVADIRAVTSQDAKLLKAVLLNTLA